MSVDLENNSLTITLKVKQDKEFLNVNAYRITSMTREQINKSTINDDIIQFCNDIIDKYEPGNNVIAYIKRCEELEAIMAATFIRNIQKNRSVILKLEPDPSL